MKYSIHWQIMDLLDDLWKIDGKKLMKEVDEMPLSYIG